MPGGKEVEAPIASEVIEEFEPLPDSIYKQPLILNKGECSYYKCIVDFEETLPEARPGAIKGFGIPTPCAMGRGAGLDSCWTIFEGSKVN